MPGSSVRRPSTTALAGAALVVSLIALTISLGGFASATPKGMGDVEILTVATGSVEVVADGEQVQVPMQDQAFTQEAGTAILFITTVRADLSTIPGDEDCNAIVAWNRLGDTLFMPDTLIVQRGIWASRQVFALPPAPTDQYHPTMEVGTSSIGECPYGEGGSYPSFTVEVEVAVLALR